MTTITRKGILGLAKTAGLVVATLIASASTAQASVVFTLSPPGAQSSPFASNPGSITETFDSLPTGILASPGSFTIGSYTASSTDIADANAYGGAGGTGKFAFVKPGPLAISVQPSKYVGFWLSALSTVNTVNIYGTGNTLLATFTASSIASLIGTPSSPNQVLAIDGATYSGADYYGNPNYNPKLDPTEAFVYVNLQLSDPNVDFVGLDFSGGNFEFDNITISPNRYVPPTPTPSVPGPVPVVGAAAALGWSRRLRRRVHSLN